MPIIENENFSTSPGDKQRNCPLPEAGASKTTANQNNLNLREYQLMEEVLTKETDLD